MKTKLKILKLLTVSIAVVLIIFFCNCGPETTECDNWPDGVVKTYYHFEEDTLKIPYHGFDTLKFLRITQSDTDTVTFIGQGKKYYEIIETDYDFYGCQHDDIYDAYSIEFKDKVNSEIICFKLFVEGEGGSELEVFYKNKRFLESLFFIDYSSMSGFITEFRILGMRFYRVHPLPPVNEWNNYKDTMYYNKFNGMIRFAYDSTYSITLLK
ncbi:MAG: hypothetical protein U9R42_13540 [Bacteroidota bacterium]|nr:hypothetical protein [Bacteroidota bacterium]